jgi:hypothetical protein
MDKKLLAKEITKIASILVGLDFDSEEEKKKYLEEHDPKPGTELNVKKEEKSEGGKDEARDKVYKHVDELTKMHKQLTDDKRDHNRKDVKKDRNQKFREVGKKLDQMAKDSNNSKVKTTVKHLKGLIKHYRETGYGADEVLRHIQVNKDHLRDIDWSKGRDGEQS